MSTPPEDFLGELRLSRRLISLTQVIAFGWVILIGLLFLLARQTFTLTGNRAPLASLLAILVLGLTLLSAVELLGGSGERGGNYILVHETLGGWSAFITGWSLLAGSVALAAAFLRETASQLIDIAPLGQISAVSLSLALLAGIILIDLLQIQTPFLPRNTLVILLTGGVIILLAASALQFEPNRFRFLPGSGLDEFIQALAWLSAGYLAFEAILGNRRQTRNPGQLLPRSLLIALIAGFLLFGLAYLVIGGLALPEQASGNWLVAAFQHNSPLPSWLSVGVSVLAMISAAERGIMIAIRHIHILSRHGALPPGLRRVRRPLPIPPALFIFLTVLISPLLVWAPLSWLVSLAAGMFLIVMVLVNITAIYSHRAEPDRRRPFTVPFNPLIPLLAITINLILLLNMPREALLGVIGWLLFGWIFYLVYAREHAVAAKEGEIVFGRVDTRDKATTYRILVPVGPGQDRHIVLNLAAALAHQLNGEVIPLQVIPVQDPIAIEAARRTARERNRLFRWSIRLAEKFGVQTYPITRIATTIADGILDTASEEECDLVLMSWPVKEDDQGIRSGTVVSAVARNVSCDLAVVATHPAPSPGRNGKGDDQRSDSTPLDGETVYRPQRILVPTAGGPNAPLAIRLALLLSKEYDARVSTIYIAPTSATEEDIREGDRRIDQSIIAMKEQAKDLPGFTDEEDGFEIVPIDGQVVKASSVVSGIAETGAAHDLVFIGVTEESLLDQVLFGNIPEQVAQTCPTPVVMVKRYRGLPRLWLMRTWAALNASLPKVNLEEQIEIYRRVHRDARPDVDFFIMMGLATLIATFGLLLNSGAVIIGAMLVAPLFTPLIALSLAIAQGNVRLLRLSIESMAKGIALAIGLAGLLSITSATGAATPEIIARTHPGFLDLFVALASGAAGAYAVARRDVATALPGVAIAAALVPPLGVVGVGVSKGDLSIIGGASLLFATNLIAIALAGAITFLLLGFRPDLRGSREAQFRRSLTTTVVLFLIITIPLAGFFLQAASQSRMERAIQSQLVTFLEEVPTLELADMEDPRIEEQGGLLIITVPVYTRGEVAPSMLESLNTALSQAAQQPVQVRLIAIPLIEAPP